MPCRRVRTIDSKLVEAVYSVEEQEYDDYLDDLKPEDILPYLHRLPNKEQDMVDLYYFMEKRQKDIAKMFSITQGAVSHRLSRARKRLRFLRDMPKVEDRVLLDKLTEAFPAMDADIIYHMTKTTCQSLVAKIINDKYGLSGPDSLTQVKVRHKFFKAIDKLRDMGESSEVHHTIYLLTMHIRNGSYLLHEVKLPHFDKGSKSVFCVS